MKYFSLLSQDEIHPAPGEKIIPAKEFSILIEAKEALDKVRHEAKEYTLNTAKESELIKEQAFKEGFEEGLNSLNQHIFSLDQELKAIREDVQKRILPLALKAARKIMGEELKLHPERIVDIVMTSLKPVTQHRKITIYVNHHDLAALEENRGTIKKIFERLDSFTIQERDDIEPGGCMIETEAGIINAQLETQWRALETAFKAFEATD